MKTVARIGARRGREALVAIALVVCAIVRPAAQERFLAKADILLYGIALKVEPSDQTVPKNIATIVSTFLQSPSAVGEALPPFAPGATVMATLRGPSFAKPLELTTSPNTPFNIPPLTTPGLHTLEDIRLVSNGEVLLRATPESATIHVIDKLLVTQVTARPLTAAEIREKGIVFDASNFQAYNFTAAFAVHGTGATVNLNFPVLLPALQGAADVRAPVAGIPTIRAPAFKSLTTIIPDTLQVQKQVPNLSVVGFTLRVPAATGQSLIVPPIPGVIVIPGNIGFLDQIFSVLLMVSNAAPAGSNLVVSGLKASIILPPGNDKVVGSADDPLTMAQTAAGASPSIQPVTQPGADGTRGTADDVGTLGPGETGNAEFLVEGRREGSQVVEMAIEGTLNGLPVGPVAITGRAAGAVLVRNPTFTLTFVHPDTVVAGEPYAMDVAVTNTSDSPANFVSVNLFPRNISGATLTGDASQTVEFIAPGDTASVTFDLISTVTGKVTAATLDSDAQVAGRFELKHSVGDLGVPLSPDSLVLPKEANALPKKLRDAAIGLLGKAWAVATAPGPALPRDVQPFSRQIVLDMGVAVAEAGLRVSLHEPVRDSVTQLALDFFGSAFGRLPSLHPAPDDLAFAQDNYTGFDALRRQSPRGDVFARAVADLLAGDFSALGAGAFHADVARKIAYRPPHLSVVVGAAAGAVPFSLTLLDGQNRQVGGVDAKGKVIKQMPFGDYLILDNGSGGTAGQMAFLVAPTPGDYRVRLDPVPGADPNTPFTLSIVVPRADGTLRQIVFDGLTAHSSPVTPFTASDPYRVSVVVGGPADHPVAVSADTTIANAPPSIVAAVQQAAADLVPCIQLQAGRIVAVLFSEEVTAASVQDRFKPADITNYQIDGNKVVGVALQPGGRIVMLALRDSIGPFVPRQITISGVADANGRAMPPQTVPILSTITDAGGVVTGRVLQADGTPVPFANVRLFTYSGCPDSPWTGISSKAADDRGAFDYDFVLRDLERIVAVDPETGEFRDLSFNVQRDGQRLNVDVVLLGRGTFTGRTLDEGGKPLKQSSVRVTSLTDQSEYGATSAADGTFTIARVPVGNVLVEAVNVPANAKTFLSDLIPFAGATTTRDLVLLSVPLTQVTVKHGTLGGHVLRGDGVSAVGGAPVIVYYSHLSQPGVTCPANAPECPVAMTKTDDQGSFAFPGVVSGLLRVHTFDAPSFQIGDVQVQLGADSSLSATVLLSAGLGTVHGTVLDATGKPVAAARVGGALGLTTTGAQGTFTLTDVPVGHAVIVAVSDALQSSGSATVDIVRAGEDVNVTVVLDATGGVAGTVRLSDGSTPASGIRTYLFEFLPDHTIRVLGATQTDDLGHYTFSKIPIGNYFVSAFKADFSDGNVAKAPLAFANQIAQANVTFRGGSGKVTGTVFGSDGVTPLAARVGVSGDQPVIAGGQVVTGFTHVQNFAAADTSLSSGRFTFANIWVGPFTVSAAGQFSPAPVAFEAVMPAAGVTVPLDIRLRPTSRVTGVVLQPDGVTPAGANIVINYKSDEFRTICSEAGGEESCTTIPQGIQSEAAVTDQDGRFALPLVNGGTFTITAEDQSLGRLGQIRGTVKAGETADLVVRLSGLGQIVVQVIGGDGHTPIPGAKVTVAQIDYPRKSLTRFADQQQGTVTFAGGDAFSEGPFTVAATDVRNGFAGRASGRIDQDGQQVVVKVFLFNQSGTVHGTVYRSDGLTPVANAEVVLTGGAASLPLAYALTGADGAYLLDQIPLGAVSLAVFDAATGRRGAGSSRVDFDHQDVAIDVTEAALGVVRGTTLDAGTLSPLKGWTVVVRQVLPDGRSQSLQAMSSVDGTFSFPGVSKGAFTVSASKQGIAGTGLTNASIATEGQVLDLPLLVKINRTLTGTIAGRVFNPDGSPAGNSVVDVGSTGAGSIVTDNAGQFSMQLPLGRYVIRAHAQASANAGNGLAQPSIDGETVPVTVTMIGVSRIDGHVEHGNGSPASNVQLLLKGFPTAGCATEDGSCTGFTDANGDFSFIDVPASRFTVAATESVSGLRGSAGDTLDAGGAAAVRIVLQPSGSVHGRVLLQNGSPAAGVAADLLLNGRHLFAQTASDGQFTLDAVALGSYSLTLNDPLAGGIARRTGTIAAAVDLGDVSLDETPPAVASVVPAASATAVPLTQAVHLTFTEKVDGGTVNAAHITLSDGASTIGGTILLETGDASAMFTPISPLKESTRYTVRATGLKDLLGKPMAHDFVAGFTTVDLTPPAFAGITPDRNTNGVSVFTTVRVQFTEPVDPLKFAGVPMVVTAGGAAVDGRLDYLQGNTVLVFTPARPLNEQTIYRVQLARAADLAGNLQATALDYQFTTTDRTPPQISRLVAPPTVIENGTAVVVADVGTSFDVAFVDFFINGLPAAVSRSAPFTLTFQAIPAFGKPGDQITIAGVATDTSGNRATSETVAHIGVVADLPPVVTITAPAAGATARNGDLVTVNVQATDDLGVTRQGYKAQTGNPQDAALVALAQASLTHTQSFSFHVPLAAAPGSTILIEASALDTKGQVGQATPIPITVLDSVAPVVTISGVSTGDSVRPGQSTNVVVSVQDLGGIAAVHFSTTGAAVFADDRALAATPTSALVSFAYQIPANARPGDSVTLTATATDKAGNVGLAANVVLPVADTVAPTLQLRTDTGSQFIVPERPFTVIGDASDGIAVARVELTGTGAFAVNAVRQVAPPTGSAQVPFTITVPAGTAPGTVLNLQGRAFDAANNASTPAFLSLTVTSLVDIVLPTSVIVPAGQSVGVTVQVPGGAPGGGQLVTFTSANTAIATVTPSLLFAAGESSKTIVVTGQSGGGAKISALIQNVERASVIATVQGGVVDGTIIDPSLVPVPGAAVTVTATNGQSGSAVSDAAGHYTITGITGPAISVKALDATSSLRGFTTATMNAANGFAHVNMVLLPAGAVHGIVHLADGQTPAPGGVKVDLFVPPDLSFPLATTFTDASGAFEFPVVTAGTYTIDATATDGRRGRTPVAVQTGADAAAGVTFLGRGSVTGTVFDAGGAPVANASLTFVSTSLFGSTAATRSAGAAGTYRFDDVFAGTFTIAATDPVSGRVGNGSGAIASDGQVVQKDLTLAAFGTVRGTVRRADGVTTVPNATVSVSGVATTTTDTLGQYQFPILPLGPVAIVVNDTATRGKGGTSVLLTTNGQVVTADIQLLGQGSVVSTVVDANSAPVSGAQLTIASVNGQFSDTLFGSTGPDGTAVVDHVLAGQLTITASKSGLGSPPLSRTLATGEVAHVSLTLAATASVSGTVFAPDGQTPQGSGRVTLLRGISGVASFNLDSTGLFRFDGLPLGDYSLRATDTLGHLRALGAASLTSNGEVVPRNLTFVRQGNVVGRVIKPDGSGAPSLGVTVTSQNPDFGRTAFATTDAAGFYEVDNLAIGAIDASVTDTPHGFLGQASGVMVSNGQVLTVNVLLQSNAFTFPITFFDANTFRYDLQTDGSMFAGSNSVFQPTPLPRGGVLLSVISGGVAVPFAGTSIGTLEDQGREVATRQLNVAGLNVTRKVFVPKTGYFARYLEVLANPTAAPITVDLRVASNIRNVLPGTNVVATSSGDVVLDVADAATRDTWAVIDDPTDVDPFLTSNLPALAFVFDGTGAAAHVASATLTAPPADTARQLTLSWSNVTVQPGQTVAFMHFVSQETSRAGAAAAATRLSQLPPEAISGLAPDEIAEIQNFAVPADGASALAPLPSLIGTVTGTAFEFDGTTPVPSAAVSYKSSDAIFGRTVKVTADAGGHFTFASKLSADATQIVIPIEDFTVSARHAQTSVTSPSFAGAFAVGEPVAARDVAFSNTGWISGRVRRQNGQTLTNGTVRATLGPGLASPIVALAADGSFQIVGVPDGSTPLLATINHAQGSALTATATAAAHAGQKIIQDLTIPATGTASGIVRTAAGAPLSGVTVNVVVPSTAFTRATVTDATGRYTLTDLPIGDYTATAIEPHSKVPTTTSITVAQDQTVQQDFTLVGLSTLSVQVNYASGGPAANAQVQLNVPQVNQTFTNVGTTDATGHVNVPNVPAVTTDVRAVHPLRTSVVIDGFGNVTADGQVVPVTLTLPVIGSITGKVTFATGAPAIGASVQLLLAGNFQQGATALSPDGHYSFQVNSPPTWSVHAINPAHTTQFKDAANLTLTSNNQALTADIVLPALATLRVTTLRDNGPLAGARVQVRSAFDVSFAAVGQTDATGTLLVPNVPEGLAAVQLFDPATNALLATNTVTIGPGDQGRTIDVPFTLGNRLPLNLFDGNGMLSDIQPDGHLKGGSNGAFRANDFRGGEFLTVNVAPFSQNFSGATFGFFEDNNRELAITQSTLLDTKAQVTRKLFVPADGYFTRYLEIVKNATGAPISAQLLLSSVTDTQMIRTSNGSNTFAAGDLWAVTDDDNGSQTSPPTRPALAFVVAGAGAATQVQSTSFTSPTWQWTPVTIAPGQTAIFMHFLSQQPQQAGALASAQRLAQLPPEALAGLSAAERAAIVNWTVPADGVGTVPPLPARTGVVSGHLYFGDGVTIAPSTSITLSSPNQPWFAPINTTTGASGQFTFTNVALDTFSIVATDPVTHVASSPAGGAFPAGQTSATQDVVFSQTGVVRGLVTRSGAPVIGASVAVVAGAVTATVATDVNGRYFISGLPGGPYTITATAAAGVRGATSVQVVNGQAVTANIAVGAGTIAGRVVRANGAPAAGAVVQLNDSAGVFGVAQTTADVTGAFAFSPVIVGAAYVVKATNPVNASVVVTSSPVVVTADGQIARADLTLPASAAVQVTVVAADGAAPIESLIAIDRHDGQGFQQAASTNSLGVATIPNVVGSFTLRAVDGFGIVGTADGTVTPASDGGVVPLRIVESGGLATVHGTVFAVDAVTPLPDDGVTVSLTNDSGQPAHEMSAGRYSFTVRVVPNSGVAFSLLARTTLDPDNPVSLGYGFGLSPGDDARLDLFAPVPVVSGTVTFADGGAVRFPNANVLLTDALGQTQTFFATRSDDSGAFGVPVLELGAFELTAQDPDSGLTAVVSGTIANVFDIVHEDVQLPEALTLSGAVIDVNGDPVPFAQVTLAAAGAMTRGSVADDSGLFGFDRVPPGPFQVTACDSLSTACGVAYAAPDNGQGPFVTVVVSPTQAVFGFVFNLFGAPIPDATVTVYSPNVTGLVNGRSTTTSANGQFIVDEVPHDNFTITAFSADGTAGTVVDQAFVPVFIYLAPNAAQLPLDLSQPSATTIQCDGTTTGGPSSARFTTSTLQIVRAAGGAPIDAFPCVPFADLRTGIRLDAGYLPGAGVRVARQVFVSDTGRFTRFLESLANVSASDVTVRVRISGALANASPLAVAPADTANTYAVFNEGSTGFGLAFGAGGAPVAATPAVADHRATFSYDYVVTIPAGETRRLMHFVYQGVAGGDISGVMNAASALSSLTFPGALDGLSAGEMATVVNFVIQ